MRDLCSNWGLQDKGMVVVRPQQLFPAPFATICSPDISDWLSFFLEVQWWKSLQVSKLPWQPNSLVKTKPIYVFANQDDIQAMIMSAAQVVMQ